MKPHYLDMPMGDAAALGEWLELILARSEIGEAVAELRALSRIEPAKSQAKDLQPRTLSETLGENREAMLERGFSALTAEQVRYLINAPDLLLELHDDLLLHGGDYWQSRFERAYTDWQQGKALSARLTPQSSISAATPTAREDRRRSWGPAAIAGWIVAAAMLVFVGLQNTSLPETKETAWGWQRSEVFAEQPDRTLFFEQLTSAAHEWYDERPETETALAKRILEFRAGCTALQLSRLTSLPPADRDWLRKQCRNWSDRIEEQLALLESGKHPREVRDAMDGLLDEATKSLQERSHLRI